MFFGDLAGDQVERSSRPSMVERGVEVDLGALDGGGQDGARRRVGRALELLAQVGRERGQLGGERGRGRGAAGDLVARAVPRLRPRRGWPRSRPGPRPAARRGRRPPRRPARPPGPWPGACRWPCSSTFSQRVGRCRACRTVRTTPPPPGSRPRVTSGRPISTSGASSDDPVVAGQRDLQPAAERGAVDARRPPAGRGSPAGAAGVLTLPVLASRRPRPRPASAAIRSFRSPPAKKVFLARGDDDAGDRRPSRPPAGRPSRSSRLAGSARSWCWRTGSGSSRVSDDDAVGAALPADGVGHVVLLRLAR